jgi:hypothetical protein
MEMDYYEVTNKDILYESGYYLPSIYGFYGFIRAIVQVPNIRDYINRDGPGGVIIFEYDRAYMTSSGWMLDSDGDRDDYFSAQYYYAQTGTDNDPDRVTIGATYAASDCEVDDVDAALARFTYNNIDSYYSVASDSYARYRFYE